MGHDQDPPSAFDHPAWEHFDGEDAIRAQTQARIDHEAHTRRDPVEVQWPAGTDPAIIAEFDQLQAAVHHRLDAIDAEYEAAVAKLERRRRWWRIAIIAQLVGLGLCVVSIFTVEWLYWAGYTLVITGLAYSWWEAGYPQKLWAWTKRKVAR